MPLSIENSWHFGISEEVFVIVFFHLNLFIVRFCSHYQLFLTVQCIAIKKKKCSVLQENQCQRRIRR